MELLAAAIQGAPEFYSGYSFLLCAMQLDAAPYMAWGAPAVVVVCTLPPAIPAPAQIEPPNREVGSGRTVGEVVFEFFSPGLRPLHLVVKIRGSS
jgi:hypothetical protein